MWCALCFPEDNCEPQFDSAGDLKIKQYIIVHHYHHLPSLASSSSFLNGFVLWGIFCTFAFNLQSIFYFSFFLPYIFFCWMPAFCIGCAFDSNSIQLVWSGFALGGQVVAGIATENALIINFSSIFWMFVVQRIYTYIYDDGVDYNVSMRKHFNIKSTASVLHLRLCRLQFDIFPLSENFCWVASWACVSGAQKRNQILKQNYLFQKIWKIK